MMNQQTPQAPGTQVPQQGRQAMQTGQRYQDVISPQDQAAIENLARAIQVCEWCADECVQLADPNMIECIRLCEDVSALGQTALTLTPRRSQHTQQHLQTVLQAVQACAQECSQHQHTHCQECAQVLGQAAQSIQQSLQQSTPPGQQLSGY